MGKVLLVVGKLNGTKQSKDNNSTGKGVKLLDDKNSVNYGNKK